jgi:hypothetical protein
LFPMLACTGAEFNSWRIGMWGSGEWAEALGQESRLRRQPRHGRAHCRRCRALPGSPVSYSLGLLFRSTMWPCSRATARPQSSTQAAGGAHCPTCSPWPARCERSGCQTHRRSEVLREMRDRRTLALTWRLRPKLASQPRPPLGIVSLPTPPVIGLQYTLGAVLMGK